MLDVREKKNCIFKYYLIIYKCVILHYTFCDLHNCIFFLSQILKYKLLTCIFFIIIIFFFTNCTVMTEKSKQTRVQYLVPCVFTLYVFESYLNIEQ